MLYVNSSPDEDFLEKDKYMAISSYEQDAGAYQAEYVWNALGKPSSFNAVLLRGPSTHNAAIGRSVSVKKYFKENGVDVNFVFDDSANWDEQQAKDMMAVLQKTHQSFDAVFCNNDSIEASMAKSISSSQTLDQNSIPCRATSSMSLFIASIVILREKTRYPRFQISAGSSSTPPTTTDIQVSKM